MLTTVTLVVTFMATEEAVEVSNLCRVMQEVSVCYLVMSAQTPTHICMSKHARTHARAHRQTCTHLEQMSQSFYFWLYLAHE